ncbi:hypothetical protein OE88DRAFT_1660874 [Heliocybe sulcata]|uniref:Uncharacterized protein n=1 Tax=Heliocybe sulcata TaxID=5364 RepID=A0A5C3MZJ1_9AGAM|nr:hypothetical protein OE88DRAFT_1660874 [Heliocybe sulcata]
MRSCTLRVPPKGLTGVPFMQTYVVVYAGFVAEGSSMGAYTSLKTEVQHVPGWPV